MNRLESPSPSGELDLSGKKTKLIFCSEKCRVCSDQASRLSKNISQTCCRPKPIFKTKPKCRNFGLAWTDSNNIRSLTILYVIYIVQKIIVIKRLINIKIEREDFETFYCCEIGNFKFLPEFELISLFGKISIRILFKICQYGSSSWKNGFSLRRRDNGSSSSSLRLMSDGGSGSESDDKSMTTTDLACKVNTSYLL
jgi:hypothetical protein